MSALDDIAGVIPIAIMGGVAMKVTENMFPTKSVPRRVRRVSKRGTKKAKLGFGNFSNLGM